MKRLIWVFSLQMARELLGTPACERDSVPATADGDCETGVDEEDGGRVSNAALAVFAFLVGAALLLEIGAQAPFRPQSAWNFVA